MVVRACNPSYSGGWGRRIAWTQETEVAVSLDRAIALQPGQKEQNSVSKKNNNNNLESWNNNVSKLIIVDSRYMEIIHSFHFCTYLRHFIIKDQKIV